MKMNDESFPIPTDPHEAAVFICARIDALAMIYSKTLNEVAEMQATVETLTECVKALMVDRGVSLRQKQTPEVVRIRTLIDSEYEDAYRFYRKQSLKRLESVDVPLVVHQEKPDSEH